MSDEIPNTDCVVRYCRPSTILNNRIIPTAFHLRPRENFISVNWMSGSIDAKIGIDQIKFTLEQSGFHIKPNGRFVIFNINNIKSYVYKATGIKISICHEYSPTNPTHASIIPKNASDPYIRTQLMNNVAYALSRFTSKNPDIVYPISSDEKIT